MKKAHSKSRWLSTLPTIRLLKSKEIVREDDWPESRRFVLTLGGPARTNIDKLKRALAEEFNTSCHHAHDCCGRWYTTVYTHTLRRLKSGTWTVRVAYDCNV